MLPPPPRSPRAITTWRSGRFAALGLVPIILATPGWIPARTAAASVGARTAAAGSCGSGGTWAVKVGSDSQAGQVNLTAPPTPRTVTQLTSLPLPSPINHRVKPTETTLFVVTATLTDVYQEHDRDLHMALNDGSAHFMLAELPDLACVPSSSPFRPGMSRAHSQLAAFTGTLPVTVQVTGVGFFDGFTGQSDQAPNQIELHPILDLNFNPGAAKGSISGAITSSAGGPISGAIVKEDGGASTTTNAQGIYTLASLAPGSHTVTASATGFVTQSKSVTVTSGSQSNAPFVLVPSNPPGAATGTVTSAADGTVIAGARVTDSGGSSATTNGAGVYSLSGLVAGSHTLTAAAGGFVSQGKSVTITSGATATADFALAPVPAPGAVSGTVTSAANGTVIAGATVSDSAGGSTTTDGSGVYTLSGLAPGSHTLSATAAGYASKSSAVTVTSGSTVTADFALTPASSAQLVQAVGATESSASTALTGTFTAPTAAGHLLVLSASVYTGATNQITSVTDNAGNTWTRIGSFFAAGHYSDGEMWYAANALSATGVTIHTGSAAVASMEVQEFSGVAATAPLDVSAGASNTGTAADSGSVTPASVNELVVGFVAGHSNTQSITVTAAGYSCQPQLTSSGGGSVVASVVTGYRVLSSAAAQRFTGSFTSGMYWSAGIATFKTGP